MSSFRQDLQFQWSISVACVSILGLVGAYPSSSKAVQVLVQSQGLLLTQLFEFLPPKEWLLARKAGSRAAPTLCWFSAKAAYVRGWGRVYCDATETASSHQS